MRFVFHSLSVCLALFAHSTMTWSDDSAKQPVELTDPFGMKFRLIRAGEFVMGSPRNWKHRGRDEGPRHTVRITRPFYLGVHEVTQGNWKEIMGTKPWNGQEYVQERDENALSCVSWNHAQAFINKLNAQSEKYQYRLPTEAEWEYACRAGSTTMFCFGNDQDQLGKYAWWGGIYNSGTAQGETYAHPVGEKLPNAWGLHDMHGNVWEWCEDWYDPKYYKVSPSEDPRGPESGTQRVIRGGSWAVTYTICRSTDRVSDSPDKGTEFYGFRLVLIPVD